MRRRQTLGQSIRHWVALVVGSMLVLAVTSVVLVSVVVPRLGGATPYTILTGSMSPGMPPGTLVVTRPVDPDDITTGMVVTYQITSGEPTVVTHRVVSQGFDGRGRLVFRTQGDANEVPDENWVRPEQIKGARWYDVPYVGYASRLLNSSQRHLAMIVVAGGLLSYATAMFGSAAVERKRRRREGVAA